MVHSKGFHTTVAGITRAKSLETNQITVGQSTYNSP